MKKRIAAALLLALACAVRAEVPLADFARFDSLSDAKISPDGAYVAFKVPLGRLFGLAILDLSSRKLVNKFAVGRVGESAIDDRSIASYEWANSRRLVISLAEHFGFAEAAFATGELLSIDADGKNGQYLFGFRADDNSTGSRLTQQRGHQGSARLIRTLPNDPAHVLIAVRDWNADKDYGTATAYRIDIVSGKLDQNLAAPIPGDVHFVADEQGFVRYASGQDEHQFVRSFVRSPEQPEWKPLATGELKNATIEPLGLSRDSRYAYLASDEGADRLCLVKQDLSGGDRKNLSCDDSTSLHDAIWSTDDDEPVAAVFEPGRIEARLLETANPSRRLLAELLKAFPNDAVAPVSHTRDGDRAIVRVYSDRNPGDYYLFDTKTLKAEYLIGQQSWIDPDQMAERRPIAYKARDGQVIHGYLTLPPGRAAKGLPLVVNPHGGPFRERDDWAWDAEPQALASRGYAVLQMNFRGSGGYGGSFVDAGKHGWASVMIDDINDGARWAIEQGIADPLRLCAYGASYGGYAALMSALRDTTLYRCVISYAGVYDLVALRKDADYTVTEYGRNYFDDFIGADDKNLAEASSLPIIGRLKAALMIVHGKDDERAPYSQAKALRAALDERKMLYEWLVKDGEGHGFYKPENRTEFLIRMIAFLDRNLVPVATPAASAAP